MQLSVRPPLSPARAARIGVLLVVPAALFLAANLLNEAGVTALATPIEAFSRVVRGSQAFNVVSAAMFLGGPALALLLNLLSIGRFDFRWNASEVAGSMTLSPRVSNVAVVVVGGLILAAFLAYLFVENFAVVQTHV